MHHSINSPVYGLDPDPNGLDPDPLHSLVFSITYAHWIRWISIFQLFFTRTRARARTQLVYVLPNPSNPNGSKLYTARVCDGLDPDPLPDPLIHSLIQRIKKGCVMAWRKIEPDNWKNEHGYQIEGQRLQDGAFNYVCYYPRLPFWPYVGLGPSFNDAERARRWCAWHREQQKS